ncbi:uncharacterized protein LOC122029875 [Zingiber officinale]|uniref:uncharacterized protein LOC122029875 n=1 Tax=Zingiber officinale TaxID=94328 RepID=UPI001C4B87C9|nr:uncharacterized protein LOC122029875 [Zingiber officinale]
MGNCQAADAAAVVIQYPGGKVERLHWPTTAANVMKSNPGYHVALVTLDVPPNERQDGGVGIRITRVKLLKPKEMLLLGQVYRLIASQEVAKALRQRQYEKLKKSQKEMIMKQKQQQKQNGDEAQEDAERNHEVTRQEQDPLKNTQTTMRGRQWRPSLQSISEMSG